MIAKIRRESVRFVNQITESNNKSDMQLSMKMNRISTAYEPMRLNGQKQDRTDSDHIYESNNTESNNAPNESS